MNKLHILIIFFASLYLSSSKIFENENQSAGILDIGDGDDMFYWLFRSRNNDPNSPLLIWLTGGPGCSSELAIFYENGPYQINDDLSLKTNNFSWNTNANLLYIDQPLGTGFSETKNPLHYAYDEQRVAETFFKFLVKFYETFPEFNSRELYISGESYAGHYIPAISDYIVTHTHLGINLKSVAIGNGWTSPSDQYPQYAEFAYENKLVGSLEYYALKAAFKICQGLISTGIWPIAFYECQIPVSLIAGMPLPRFNLYDIRKKCDHPPLCYDFSNLDKFIALPEVRKEIGVGDRNWSSCNMLVHFIMLGDWVTNMKSHVINLLKNKVNVLVYSGTTDYICNWKGGEAWTHNLDWEGNEEFNKQDYSSFKVNGEVKGEFKSYDGLTFLKIFEAGHMVPMDQPEAALFMIDNMMDKAKIDLLKSQSN